MALALTACQNLGKSREDPVDGSASAPLPDAMSKCQCPKSPIAPGCPRILDGWDGSAESLSTFDISEIIPFISAVPSEEKYCHKRQKRCMYIGRLH